MDCLTPPLSRVPVEEWFCPECADREGMYYARGFIDYVMTCLDFLGVQAKENHEMIMDNSVDVVTYQSR